MGIFVRTILLLAVASLTAAYTRADSFTTAGDFNTAISGMSNITTTNFDSNSVGNLPSGGINGITFSYTPSMGTAQLQIVNLFDTTSPSNYLGSDDPGTGAFFDGDTVTMSFASPVTALGMYIVFGPGPFGSDDFTLSSTPASASNSGVLETTLEDGGQVLFLGITSSTPFSSATINLNSQNGELWNLDDITTAQGATAPTPEPATLALVGGALALCARRFRKLRAAKSSLSC
jgi:PEP-CTERM motif